MAAILGGAVGATIVSTPMMALAYLVAGYLSRGLVIPAVSSGVVFAVLYPLLVIRSGR